MDTASARCEGSHIHTEAFFHQVSKMTSLRSLHRYSVLSISYTTGRQVVQFNKYNKTYRHLQYKQIGASLKYILTVWILTGANQTLSKQGKW